MFAGIAVFEGNQTFNISHEFPCFLGYSPNKHLPKADVGLLVDVDVPWFPADVSHKDKSFWAHIDVDTLKSASPMWTFPGNLRMQGDFGVILGQLLEELKKKATPKFKEAAAEARRGAHRRAQGLARERDEDGDQQGQRGRDQPALPVRRAEQAAQGRRHRLQRRRPQRRRLPAAARAARTRTPASAPAAAVSAGPAAWRSAAKLAAPDKMVVQVVGDGGFYFGGPSSVFAVAKQYKLPILVLLLDNTGWSAVKESTLAGVPGGRGQVGRPVPGRA